ncbi:MAG: methyltransferase domain-containing protein [Ethanoligenens sp.]|uniref:class I SAM-dependent methyltransferase n=1 Tax=Ethanoligenens sp. TaxID=2099655 RepID=UPI0039E7FEC0
MYRSNELVKSKYNRAAHFYDFFEGPMELLSLKKWRQELMAQLEGRVLEVGVGTGKNIPYYPKCLSVTAIDFSEKMLSKAEKKIVNCHSQVQLNLMDVQHLDFPDDSFDTVLSTCVFCSVPDPVEGLKEIRRVCKPGGKIVMLEHVRSENALLGPIMDVFNPIVFNLYGANINRKTLDNIRKAGFASILAQNLFFDIVKLIAIHNEK